MGFSITGITEFPLLNSSIPKIKEKGKIFSKIDKKGYSRYCYLGCISKIVAGYLYMINPYIPVVICFGICILVTIISWNYIEIETKENEKISIKKNIEDIKNGFSYIAKSPRLRALILMLGVIWGLIIIFTNYQTTLLKDMSISASYISIISAMDELITGFAAKRATDYNKKYKNKSLTIMGMAITIGAIIIGGVTILKIPIGVQITIIITAFFIRAIMKGFYQILKKQYLGNFASSTILPKIYASNNIICNMGRAIISYIGSMLLVYTDVGKATMIMGFIFLCVIIVISMYMKDRVGIEPKVEKSL